MSLSVIKVFCDDEVCTLDYRVLGSLNFNFSTELEIHLDLIIVFVTRTGSATYTVWSKLLKEAFRKNQSPYLEIFEEYTLSPPLDSPLSSLTR